MPSENTEQRKLAAIMFTDMVGYSALSQRNEALALQLLEEHRAILRGLFPGHQGTEIKTMGDGFLVEFASALAAVRCAVAIQHALAERNRSQPHERQVLIRIGIHLGDVERSEHDVHGDGVNIAARIEPLAEPGGICISNAVYDQIENKVEQTLVRLSRPELKNIQASVQVYKLVLGGMRPRAIIPAKRPHNAFPLAVLALLVASIILVLIFNGPPRSAPRAANAPSVASADAVSTNQKSIAVLPFVNMSADKSDEYLSDGMTEELLNRLAQVPGLRVPGRTSSFAFKGKSEDDIFRKIGEQLSVSTVLEGSVRKAGDKLRVTAQLINVADGFHLWSETYDGDMKDILAFQSDVAQRVAQALQMKLGVEETRALAKHPTENPEAHRLYLLGRFDFLKGTEAGWNGASNYYTQALQLDPNYALAYCGLADNYGWMGGSVLSGREAWAREKVLAQKAVALNPSLADAHLSLGTALVSAFEWREGEREMKRALELNPNLAFAYDNYAWLLTLFGRFDEAIAREHKALDIDPLSPLINSDYGATLMNSRRYDDAIALLRKALKLDPNYAQSHYELGWCLFWKGQPAPAIAEFQLAKKLDDSPTATGSLGYIYAVSGDRARAEQALRELEDLSHRRYVTPWAPAVVHLALGEKDQALDWLEKCYADQDGACWSLNIDPVLDGLRNEPRFQALLKKTGLSNPL